MSRTTKTLARIAGLAMGLTLLPATAYAVGVSSIDGDGSQAVTTKYNNGAAVGGNLRVKNTGPVFYEGRINWTGFTCSSTSEVGRYTTNTNSYTYVAKSGTITKLPGSCTSTGVNSRVARDVPVGPDTAGAWSAKY